jgi:DNA repair exonuclease SbcCD ATPase subunit
MASDSLRHLPGLLPGGFTWTYLVSLAIQVAVIAAVVAIVLLLVRSSRHGSADENEELALRVEQSVAVAQDTILSAVTDRLARGTGETRQALGEQMTQFREAAARLEQAMAELRTQLQRLSAGQDAELRTLAERVSRTSEDQRRTTRELLADVHSDLAGRLQASSQPAALEEARRDVLAIRDDIARLERHLVGLRRAVPDAPASETPPLPPDDSLPEQVTELGS